jgi:hypothetical protein
MCAAPGRRAHDRDLGDRRVDHALLAELRQQSLGDLERAAERADVLAEQKTFVARHLLEQRLADGLEIGDLAIAASPPWTPSHVPHPSARSFPSDGDVGPLAEPERLLRGGSAYTPTSASSGSGGGEPRPRRWPRRPRAHAASIASSSSSRHLLAVSRSTRT